MEPVLLGLLAVGILLLFMATGMPIAASFLLVAIGGLWMKVGFSQALQLAALQSYSAVAILGLTVMPMFILLGIFVLETGMSPKAFAFAYKWVGGWPGGLAVATTLSCAIFGAVSGSSIAAVASIGKMVVPEMVDKFKYNRGLAAGAVAASGTLAIMIPPSTALAFYAIWVEISVAKQLMAGLIPGIISALIYMVMIAIRCKVQPSLAPMRPERVSWNERLRSIPSIWQFALLFVIVIGGIYSGVFTPTEAGATGALVTLVMLVMIKRRQALGAIGRAFWEAASITGMIFFLIVGARTLGDLFTLIGFARALGDFITSLPVPPVVALLLLLSLTFPMGMVMGSLPIIVLLMPLMLPVVTSLGYSLIWFGIIITKTHEIALITPPVCMNVFVLQATVPEFSFVEIVRGTLWFLAMDTLTLAILFAFPVLSLWLPNLMFSS